MKHFMVAARAWKWEIAHKHSGSKWAWQLLMSIIKTDDSDYKPDVYFDNLS